MIARLALALAAWLAAAPGSAHEFWIRAEPDGPARTRLQLFVGEALAGDRVAWTREHVQALRLHGAAGAQDLLERVPGPDARAPEFALALPGTGTRVLAYESHPSEVTLEPGLFHAYLREEGLEAIARERTARGQAGQPGRERFRRSAKIVLRAAGPADAGALVATGQRMELLPLQDPGRSAPGATLPFEARWRGQPLAGVLVKAWHRGGDQTTLVRATTDSQGRVRLRLPFAGSWLLNAVHMVAAPAGDSVDWESDWASLAFEIALPGRR